MTIMQRLGQIEHSIETQRRAKAFVAYARLLAGCRGDRPSAMAMAQARGMVSEATAGIRLAVHGGARAVKAAVAAGNTTDSTWAAPLAEYERTVEAFLETLRSASAFERLLPEMKLAPLRTRLAIVTTGATGNIVGQGAPTPISSLALEGDTLDEVKAVAIVVASMELLKVAGGPGAEMFERELRGAIATTVDTKFLSLITDGVTPIMSSGEDVIAVRADVAAAYAAIETSAQSRLFWLMDSPTAKALTVKGTTAGDAAFPQMTPMGGVLCGCPAIVTDGVAAGQMVLVDANGIAAGSDTVEIDTATQATLQMETAPDNPAVASSVMTSLWQHNMVGIKASRFFGAQRLGNSVQVIDTVSYDSP